MREAGSLLNKQHPPRLACQAPTTRRRLARTRLASEDGRRCRLFCCHVRPRNEVQFPSSASVPMRSAHKLAFPCRRQLRFSQARRTPLGRAEARRAHEAKLNPSTHVVLVGFLQLRRENLRVARRSGVGEVLKSAVAVKRKSLGWLGAKIPCWQCRGTLFVPCSACPASQSRC